MLGIPIALLASNATEWFVHKYVLHGLGKKKDSFWAFHWHEHHGTSRRNGMHDEHYEKSVFGKHSQGKEAAALVAGGILLAPLFPVAPFFTMTAWYCGYNYYRQHKRSHLDPEWAREHLPWHYDHHMGPKQDANWCVTKPWFDHLMGTRVPYVGTEREKKDVERKQRRAAAAAARAAKKAALARSGAAPLPEAA